MNALRAQQDRRIDRARKDVAYELDQLQQIVRAIKPDLDMDVAGDLLRQVTSVAKAISALQAELRAEALLEEAEHEMWAEESGQEYAALEDDR